MRHKTEETVGIKVTVFLQHLVLDEEHISMYANRQEAGGIPLSEVGLLAFPQHRPGISRCILCIFCIHVGIFSKYLQRLQMVLSSICHS